MSTNIEKKQKMFEDIIYNYKHLENYCKITAYGIEDDSIYFHPKFELDEDTYISSQSDIGSDKGVLIYAIKFVNKLENIQIEIYDDLIESIIIGYHANKDTVKLALSTLSKIRNHINQLNNYTTDYVHNILIGNSIQGITDNFINELKITNQIVDFMQKTKLQ